MALPQIVGSGAKAERSRANFWVNYELLLMMGTGDILKLFASRTFQANLKPRHAQFTLSREGKPVSELLLLGESRDAAVCSSRSPALGGGRGGRPEASMRQRQGARLGLPASDRSLGLR